MERYTRILLVLAAAVAVSLCQPLERITNGEPIPVQMFPSVAAVLQQDDSSYSLRCGAAVLTSFYVLTAASCVTESLKVRVGSATWSSGGRLVDVLTSSIHPDFENDGVDLALLGLAQPIIFNDTSVGQAPMPFQNMEPTVGMAAFVLGWGASEPSGDPSDELRFGFLSITERSQCSEAFSTSMPWKIISDSQICASGKADLCQGDAGNPLYSAGLLVGIASYFPNCGEHAVPSVYTHVARYLTWIQENASGVPKR